MHPKLQNIQWLFFDPSVLLNETATEFETRRQIVAAFARRGQSIGMDQIDRAWMQALNAPQPVHPLAGAIQVLAGRGSDPADVLGEVLSRTSSLDAPFAGVHLVLNNLLNNFNLGVIGPYRIPGGRAQLERFRLALSVLALGDEQHLSFRLDVGGRPDPALFVWALRKAGCPSANAAYASDRVDLGLAPAKMAGMTTIWLRQTNHKHRHPRSTIETPDLTFNTLAELTRI